MTTRTRRTPKQILASTLRRKEFEGCRGQACDHGAGRLSIVILASADDPRFLDRPLNAQGTRVVVNRYISE